MEKTKFNLMLTDKAKAQLENLRERTGAMSLAVVIRDALTVYDALQKHTSENWQVVLRKGSQELLVKIPIPSS